MVVRLSGSLTSPLGSEVHAISLAATFFPDVPIASDCREAIALLQSRIPRLYWCSRDHPLLQVADSLCKSRNAPSNILPTLITRSITKAVLARFVNAREVHIWRQRLPTLGNTTGCFQLMTRFFLQLMTRIYNLLFTSKL